MTENCATCEHSKWSGRETCVCKKFGMMIWKEHVCKYFQRREGQHAKNSELYPGSEAE